jgi:hypothetical protein
MPYTIKCAAPSCGELTRGGNIVELLRDHRDKAGWFLCGSCKQSTGFVERRFRLQEEGQHWEPYLRGAIVLGELGNSYQPFVFLVSESPEAAVDSCWFCYYKDTRNNPDGTVNASGRLKLGYGPGGPPMLPAEMILALIRRLVELRVVVARFRCKVLASKRRCRWVVPRLNDWGHGEHEILHQMRLCWRARHATMARSFGCCFCW